MIHASTTRRRFPLLAAGTGVASRAALAATGSSVSQEEDRSGAAVSLGDSKLLLEFDRSMRSRAWHVRSEAGGQSKQPLTPWAATEYLLLSVSTKFTWPQDPKRKDSFLLTPQKEALWRKWIALYNERLLPKGTYRGELYDIGFDKPETHVVEKSGRLYYALYAHTWSGPVSLRGLPAGRHRVRDYVNGRDLGEVSAPGAALPLAFERFLLLQAMPV